MTFSRNHSFLWSGATLRATAVAALLIAGASLTACSAEDGQTVVRVPQDAPTISDAIEAVPEGGLVLVSPGTYAEEVLIDKPGVTLRGENRNTVIIDAEGKRPYGIVGVEEGITIENLTTTGATFYGVLITGMYTEDGPIARDSGGYADVNPEEFPPVQRFLIDHVTATNNGLYGIYAFDAQNGVIRNSYASGSSDSGFYVGQCRECAILVENNIALNNAVGFENANASDSVWVVNNDFSGNRIGMTFLSDYQEAFTPQRANWVAGNIIAANVSEDSPAHAQGGWGVGIGLSGATENLFEWNLIVDNPVAGVTLANAEDLAVTGNVFNENRFQDNGVDLLNVSSSRAPAQSNCILGDESLDGLRVTTMPNAFLDDCEGTQPAVGNEYVTPNAPPGVSYLKVAKPPKQESLSVSASVPKPLPDVITRPDTSTIHRTESTVSPSMKQN